MRRVGFHKIVASAGCRRPAPLLFDRKSARALREILEGPHFAEAVPTVNPLHHLFPFPYPASPQERIQQSPYSNETVPSHEILCDLFVYGRGVNNHQIKQLKLPCSALDVLIQAGILEESPEGTLRSNSLSTTIRRLTNGKTLYLIADSPGYYGSRDGRIKTYLNTDSFL